MQEADTDALQDIVEYGEKALQHLQGRKLQDFLDDETRRLAVERLLEIVGEAAGRLSPAVQHEMDVDFRAVRGLRNILAHRYGDVDPRVLFNVVRGSLPKLLDEARRQLG